MVPYTPSHGRQEAEAGGFEQCLFEGLTHKLWCVCCGSELELPLWSCAMNTEKWRDSRWLSIQRENYLSVASCFSPPRFSWAWESRLDVLSSRNPAGRSSWEHHYSGTPASPNPVPVSSFCDFQPGAKSHGEIAERPVPLWKHPKAESNLDSCQGNFE